MMPWFWILLLIFTILGLGGAAVVAEASGKLSAAEIAVFARNAGFQGNDLTTAVAIALAESGGNPSSKGDKTTGAKNYGGKNLPVGTPTSYGLWQIHWTVHPEVLNGADPSILLDPQENACAAFTVFKEQGFNAWSTFGNQPGHNNAYSAHLDDATTGVNA